MNFNRVFHYNPSILGYPYFWKHPNISAIGELDLITDLTEISVSDIVKGGRYPQCAPVFLSPRALVSSSFNGRFH